VKGVNFCNSAVIVKKIEFEQTGNIIVPDIGNGKNEFGEVIDVGPGSYTLMGELIPTKLKKGDKVVLPTMGFTKFDFEDETYYVGKENEILSKIVD
jgi:chaperonin GroES